MWCTPYHLTSRRQRPTQRPSERKAARSLQSGKWKVPNSIRPPTSDPRPGSNSACTTNHHHHPRYLTSKSQSCSFFFLPVTCDSFCHSPHTPSLPQNPLRSTPEPLPPRRPPRLGIQLRATPSGLSIPSVVPEVLDTRKSRVIIRCDDVPLKPDTAPQLATPPTLDNSTDRPTRPLPPRNPR